MNPEARPISVSTVFSLALHAALISAVWQTQEVMLATGEGIEIELVSSDIISTDAETERAAKQATASSQPAMSEELPARDITDVARRSVEVKKKAETDKPQKVPMDTSSVAENDSGNKTVTRSTNASKHSDSIIELLHTKISEHKQYPYLARRQRREGTARVEFMLYPDGSVDAARLVRSSRTRSLDKAALEAVESIEPFGQAREYLNQPAAFQVDVVFNVM